MAQKAASLGPIALPPDAGLVSPSLPRQLPRELPFERLYFLYCTIVSLMTEDTVGRALKFDLIKAKIVW